MTNSSNCLMIKVKPLRVWVTSVKQQSTCKNTNTVILIVTFCHFTDALKCKTSLPGA